MLLGAVCLHHHDVKYDPVADELHLKVWGKNWESFLNFVQTDSTLIKIKMSVMINEFVKPRVRML